MGATSFVEMSILWSSSPRRNTYIVGLLLHPEPPQAKLRAQQDYKSAPNTHRKRDQGGAPFGFGVGDSDWSSEDGCGESNDCDNEETHDLLVTI